MSDAPSSGLFEPPMPPGFVYRAEIISPAEATALTVWLDGLGFRPFEFRGIEARRQVVSFGWRYDSNRARLEPAEDLPAELAALRARAADLAAVAPGDLQQVLINKYEPGAPIGWHRDRQMFGKIVGVSLLAPCTFRLRRRTGDRFERLARILEPRSAYLLSGPARQVWEHSIPPAPALRYSITFRDFSGASAN